MKPDPGTGGNSGSSGTNVWGDRNPPAPSCTLNMYNVPTRPRRGGDESAAHLIWDGQMCVRMEGEEVWKTRPAPKWLQSVNL